MCISHSQSPIGSEPSRPPTPQRTAGRELDIRSHRGSHALQGNDLWLFLGQAPEALNGPAEPLCNATVRFTDGLREICNRRKPESGAEQLLIVRTEPANGLAKLRHLVRFGFWRSLSVRKLFPEFNRSRLGGRPLATHCRQDQVPDPLHEVTRAYRTTLKGLQKLLVVEQSEDDHLDGVVHVGVGESGLLVGSVHSDPSESLRSSF